MKRYQRIGFPERDMADFDTDFKHSLSFSAADALVPVTYAHASYVVCHHLELMEIPNWMSHAHWCCENVVEQISKKTHEQTWFEPLSLALLCGSYVGLWRELSSLASVNMYVFEEDYLGTAPHELQYILLEVLYSLTAQRPEPSMNAKGAIDQTTNKKAQRYIHLWRAVETGNQNDFETILKDSVARSSRRKKPPADATFPLEWVAIFESIVANFAKHRGMKIPALPKKQQPLLMLCNSD